MNLKFVCSEKFELAGKICNKMKGYLPNLIGKIEIVRNDAFRGIFDFQDILPRVESAVRPDWEREIVVVVIEGSLYFADLELFEPVAMTLDYLPSRKARGKSFLSKRPKVGALLLPNNMSDEPRGSVEYWAKLGVEEILHYFGIPEQHDENCFFHAKEFGKATLEDCWKNYCPKCREFMQQLKYPLDFEKLFVKMDEIYEIKAERREWKAVLKGYFHKLLMQRCKFTK